MENVLSYFKYIVAFIGTGFTWLFGTWDTALMVLICFMVLDYLTGLLRAIVNKEVSSDTGLKGIARKGVIFVVLIRTVVCYFYIANEGISLLENCAGLGLPIPDAIKDALVQLKEGEKKEIRGEE